MEATPIIRASIEHLKILLSLYLWPYIIPITEQILTPKGIEKKPVVMKSTSIITAIAPMILALDILSIYNMTKLNTL